MHIGNYAVAHYYKNLPNVLIREVIIANSALNI